MTFLSVMATNTMVVYGMVTSVINARPQLRLKFLPTALILGGAKKYAGRDREHLGETVSIETVEP